MPRKFTNGILTANEDAVVILIREMEELTKLIHRYGDLLFHQEQRENGVEPELKEGSIEWADEMYAEVEVCADVTEAVWGLLGDLIEWKPPVKPTSQEFTG